MLVLFCQQVVKEMRDEVTDQRQGIFQKKMVHSEGAQWRRNSRWVLAASEVC